MAEKMQEALKLITGLYPVEGFNPQDVKREILKEDNTKDYFLPLVWKKAWARKIYPFHRCEAELMSVKDGYVSCRAKFYVDNDVTKAHIGEGFAIITVNQYAPDPIKEKNDACLKAIGSAKARAYSDAGFGLEFFTDCEMEDIEAAANATQVTTPDCIELLQVKEVAPEYSSTNPIDSAESKNSIKIETADEVNEPTNETTKRCRASQYEMAKKANEELLSLREQIPSQVNSFLSSAEGSVENVAAQKSLDKIEKRWAELAKTISKKMSSQQVQADRQADVEYEFINSTYEQEFENAKNALQDSIDAVDENSNGETCVESDNSQGLIVVDSSELSLEDAKKFIVVTEPYAGYKLGDMYIDPVKKNILPVLFDKSDDIQEKKYLKLLIESDDMLMSYCKRNGKLLEI